MENKPNIPDFPDLPDLGNMIAQACELIANIRGIPYDFNGTLSLENKFTVLFKTVQEMFKAQASLIESYKELYEFIKSYFDKLDVQENVNKKIEDMVASGELLNLIKPSTIAETDKWLAEHITNPSNPPLDSSLLLDTAAAQAKTVGNYFENLITTYDGNVKLSMFENGNVDISSNSVIYRDNKNRVRTKNGVTLSLKSGDVIKLRDYVKYTVLVLETTKLVRFGWMTFDFCVPIDGSYALNITTTEDKTPLDVVTAFGQLEIVRDGCKYNALDLIHANTDTHGEILYQDYSVMHDRLLHIKAGAAYFPVNNAEMQVSYFDKNGNYLRYESYTKFHVFTADSHILCRFKKVTSNVEQTISYQNFAQYFHFAFQPITEEPKKTLYSFAGYSKFVNKMPLAATITPISSYPSSSASVILTKNKKTIGIDFSLGTPDVMVNYLNNVYYYNCTNRIDAIVITHFHSDHTGGLPALVNKFGVNIVGAVAFLPQPLTAENTANLQADDVKNALAQQDAIIALLKAKNCTIIYPTENSTYQIDNVMLTFKNCSYTPYMTRGEVYYSNTYNDYSMCIEAIDGNFVTTYTGDIQKQAQKYLAKKMRKANVITSPHHGWLIDAENLISDFVNNISPDIVITEGGSEQKAGGIADIDGTGGAMTVWCEENGVPNYATFENGTIHISVADGVAKFERPVIRHVKTK